jgi:hypothetical protein
MYQINIVQILCTTLTLRKYYVPNITHQTKLTMDIYYVQN